MTSDGSDIFPNESVCGGGSDIATSDNNDRASSVVDSHPHSTTPSPHVARASLDESNLSSSQMPSSSLTSHLSIGQVQEAPRLPDPALDQVPHTPDLTVDQVALFYTDPTAFVKAMYTRVTNDKRGMAGRVLKDYQSRS